jgi:hypothetical protein
MTFLRATSAEVDEVRTTMIRGRERFLIATAEQLASLPVGSRLRRRPQILLRCEPRPLPHQCRVGRFECYGTGPDIELCGAHDELPDVSRYV